MYRGLFYFSGFVGTIHHKVAARLYDQLYGCHCKLPGVFWGWIDIKASLYHYVDRRYEKYDDYVPVRSQRWDSPPIASFVGPTWDPSGADRTQVGPMLVPWTLLSGSTPGKTVFVWKLVPRHKYYIILYLALHFLGYWLISSATKYIHLPCWRAKIDNTHPALQWRLC